MSITYIRKTNPTVRYFDSESNAAFFLPGKIIAVTQTVCLSNRYPYAGSPVNPEVMPDKSFGTSTTSDFVVKDSRFTSAEVAEELLQGAEFVAKLFSPITATIDPTTIALNEGENYVWTEEGTTTLTYKAKV